MPSTSTLVDSIYTRRVSAGECYPPDLVKSLHFYFLVTCMKTRQVLRTHHAIRHAASFFVSIASRTITDKTVSYVMLAIGDWRLAIGGWRLAVGGWRLAVGGQV